MAAIVAFNEEEEEEGSLWLPLLTISDSYFFPKSRVKKSGRGEVKNSISSKQYFGRRLSRRGSRLLHVWAVQGLHDTLK